MDGSWGEWGKFGPCSVTCEVGVKTRRRSCSSPINNGKECVGNSTESTECILDECGKFYSQKIYWKQDNQIDILYNIMFELRNKLSLVFMLSMLL